jgi:hypothetical protein
MTVNLNHARICMSYRYFIVSWTNQLPWWQSYVSLVLIEPLRVVLWGHSPFRLIMLCTEAYSQLCRSAVASGISLTKNHAYRVPYELILIVWVLFVVCWQGENTVWNECSLLFGNRAKTQSGKLPSFVSAMYVSHLPITWYCHILGICD